MKKRLLISFIAIMVLLVSTIDTHAAFNFRNGQYVKINGYTFRVLNADQNLLLLHKNLENRKFGNNANWSTNDTSNLGYYLNTTFKDNLGLDDKYLVDLPYNNYTGKVRLVTFSEYTDGYRNGSISRSDGTYWWTITKFSSSQLRVVAPNGENNHIFYSTQSAGVKPLVRLQSNSNLGIISGTGTASDPFVIMDAEKVVTDISDLSLIDVGYNYIKFAWKNPTEPNFSHVRIYKNGELIESNFTGNQYTFSNLQPSRDYELMFQAVGKDGFLTNGITSVISTEAVPIVPEVTGLNANTKHNRVDLTWKRPESEFFHHVKIYRKELEEQTVFNLLNMFTPSVAYAENEEYDLLFETNGTYFNDLTVESETTYEYKLTTENIEGAESEGVTIQATTPAPPLPEMSGVTDEQDENGDYIYKWTSPTKGQVKILVGGAEYATVPASDRQITIPKEDMKYTVMGNPDVRLVPISESGKEGKPNNPNLPFSGTELPFKANDLLTTSMGIIWLLAPFLLLVLAVIVTKKIIQVIRKSAETRRSARQGGVNNERRRS